MYWPMHATYYFIEFAPSGALQILRRGLKGLSHPETARRGMHLAEFGMLVAVIGTLLHHEVTSAMTGSSSAWSSVR